jgi:hypothetical protein
MNRIANDVLVTDSDFFLIFLSYKLDGLLPEHRAFGRWMEEKHGFCSYINVLAGCVWVVISKPKKQGGHKFDDVATLTNLMDPAESNLRLWDVEAILLEAGSQL